KLARASTESEPFEKPASGEARFAKSSAESKPLKRESLEPTTVEKRVPNDRPVGRSSGSVPAITSEPLAENPIDAVASSCTSSRDHVGDPAKPRTSSRDDVIAMPRTASEDVSTRASSDSGPPEPAEASQSEAGSAWLRVRAK